MIFSFSFTENQTNILIISYVYDVDIHEPAIKPKKTETKIRKNFDKVQTITIIKIQTKLPTQIFFLYQKEMLKSNYLV